MTDHDHDDLGDRLEHAVSGLRAPDVTAAAMAQGRRLRARRRVAYGVGSVAAATALVLAVPAVASQWSPGDDGDSTPSVAAEPTSTPTSRDPDVPPDASSCGPEATGWWSTSSEEIGRELARVLPDGVDLGAVDDDWAGTWGGNLTQGGDEDFASLTLLPPPGVPGPTITLEDARKGRCFGGDNEPMQQVLPCAELSGYVTCEEVRDDRRLVGVVTEKVESTIVDGQEQPTDRGYVLGTIRGPGGGHVELYVAEGTRADRPDTVHDPADVPALTPAQVRAILTDPVWTS